MSHKLYSNQAPIQSVGALVPGLPHLLRGDLNPQWGSLAVEMERLGDDFASMGVQRVVYFSTKWLSVLGQMFQGRPLLEGHHVDEMWYDFGEIPYSFRVDRDFAQELIEGARADGYQSHWIDYEGFPVDTGTIVADRLLNKGSFFVNMVACSLYLDFGGMQRFAKTVRQVIDKDPVPTALVVVSGLSGHWHRKLLPLGQDEPMPEADDRWNRRILGLCETGQYKKLAEILPDYSRECHVDMGGLAFAFLTGFGLAQESVAAHVQAYESIYGTGAAIVSFSGGPRAVS